MRDLIQGLVAPHGQTHADGGEDEIPGFCPVGTVLDWYGTLVNGQPPYRNWRLADGTVKLPNGLTPPDYRNFLRIGAGNTYALGATVQVDSAALALVAIATYPIIRIR